MISLGSNVSAPMIGHLRCHALIVIGCPEWRLIFHAR
jgi:hypothetical protein